MPSSSECVDTTEEVRLPSPTNHSPLIFPQASITVQGLPPVALISYLDTLPTVTEQLSGTIASSCDPIVGSTVTPKTVNQNDNQPTTVAQLDGNSATTSTHYTIAAIDTAAPPPSGAPPAQQTPSPPLPSNTGVAPASSSAAPQPSSVPPVNSNVPPVSSNVPPASSAPGSSIAPSIAPASSAAASNLQSLSLVRPSASQTGLTAPTAPTAPASSAAANSNTLIASAQSSLATVGTGTHSPPPTPASSSALPLQATGAAAHQRANMQHVGLEHWLIGAAGIGLGWL